MMRKLIPLSLVVLVLNGCELPLTDQRHFDHELEKRERDLIIRKDFATGEEKRLLEKDLDRIQGNYIFSAPEDVFEMLPSQEGTPRRDKDIDQKITRELERASNEAQRLKSSTPLPITPLEPTR